MKKTIFLSSIFAIGLFANSFELNIVDQNPQRISPTQQNKILSYNAILNDSIKSVVNISTKKRIKIGDNPIMQMFADPFFQQFFGDSFGLNQIRQKFQKSLGSGVVLTKDGYIITNAHIVQDAQEIVVSLKKNDDYNARLIGIDINSDIAIIKIDPKKDLSPIRIGSSKNLKIGDVVFAIGNPFGIGQTVTQGIISSNRKDVGKNSYENFIQTDASINPGNSGGALVDSTGVLIGINSAIITRNGDNNGIGFAIPVSIVKTIAKKLVKDGKVARAYLGVSIDNLPYSLKDLYKHKKGVLVLDIQKETPAYKSNLKRGDLIYMINNKSVSTAKEFTKLINSFSPNENITIKLERDKKDISLNIKLGSRDILTNISTNSAVLGGLYLSEITNENSKKYRLSKTVQGVLITDIKVASDAEKIGFQVGDVIVQIENIEINSLKDIQNAINRYQGVPKRVFINRYGRIIPFVVK